MMGHDTTSPAEQDRDTTITIGSVRFRDVAQVRQIQLQAFRKRLAYSTSTLYFLWALPNVPFLVARKGNLVLGCAIGDRQNGHSRVINLAVDPAARRQGVGRQLLDALESILPDGDMILMVESGNQPARLLYERAGYVSIGTGHNYYGVGYDGIWMRKFRASTSRG